MVRDRNPIFHIAYVQIFIQQNPSSVQIVLFMKCVISTRKNSNIFNWIRLRVRLQWNSEREREKKMYTQLYTSLSWLRPLKSMRLIYRLFANFKQRKKLLLLLLSQQRAFVVLCRKSHCIPENMEISWRLIC